MGTNVDRGENSVFWKMGASSSDGSSALEKGAAGHATELHTGARERDNQGPWRIPSRRGRMGEDLEGVRKA